MKRISYLLLVFLGAISCTGKQQKTTAEGIGELRFDSILVEEKIQMPLIPEEPDYIPYATFNVKFVFPISFGTEEQLQKLQAIFYEKVLGEKYADASSPQEAIERYKKNFPEWAQGFGIPIHYYNNECANRIVFTNKNVLNFCVFSRDEESSQPRASFGEYYYCIDLQALKLLTLDDLLIGDYKIDLIDVIKKNIIILMKETFSGSDLEEVLNDIYGYWGDCEICDLHYAFNNFALTEKGITFNYTDREIAFLPGDYQVHVSYGEIANLLNRDMFAKLFPDIDLQEEATKFKVTEEDRELNYNDYPIAYVKNSKLYFFNPENEATIEFTEETDSVFNCVYSDQDAMFYYTVSRDGKLSIKQMDLSNTFMQPKLLFDLNKPTEEFFTETDFEKANLKFINGNLLLECDFVWDYYSFTKFYNYSIKNNTLTIIDWGQFESRYGYHPYSPEDESSLKGYKSVYNKARRLDLSKYMHEDYGNFETEYFFQGASADGSKIVFSIMLGFGDLAHGPYCVADADGTNMQILENTDMGYSFKPLWCNNNVVYICSYESETEKYDWGGAKQIIEFCYTRAADNSIVGIDDGVDYYGVRKKHPIK